MLIPTYRTIDHIHILTFSHYPYTFHYHYHCHDINHQHVSPSVGYTSIIFTLYSHCISLQNYSILTVTCFVRSPIIMIFPIIHIFVKQNNHLLYILNNQFYSNINHRFFPFSFYVSLTLYVIIKT